jgi:hypothetical protein
MGNDNYLGKKDLWHWQFYFIRIEYTFVLYLHMTFQLTRKNTPLLETYARTTAVQVYGWVLVASFTCTYSDDRVFLLIVVNF